QPLLLAAALFTAAAGAQMKLPRSIAPSPAAAAAAPAAAGEGAPTAAAPNPNVEKETAAKLAAGGWLILLDRGDWGRAWETASGVFRSSVPLPAWIEGIPKAREPFGTAVERNPVEAVYKTALAGRPPGEYVTVIFDTKFANKQVEEVVTMVLESDGRWRATGYSTR
ncbi:MAG: DUF4019 domain-containing protein, partial [Ramlibacter sp.]